MEYVEQPNIKKLCNFYVSNLHLFVMLLPFINKQINEDVEITTVFEKIEKHKFEEVVNKMNIRNKEKLLNIDWFDSCKDTNEKIINSINSKIKKNKKVLIIIAGKEKYVLENRNKILNNLNVKELGGVSIEIVDCYNVEEVKSNMKNIVNKYDGILNTLGENKISSLV